MKRTGLCLSLASLPSGLTALAILLTTTCTQGAPLDLAQQPARPPIPATAGWAIPVTLPRPDRSPGLMTFATAYEENDWSGALTASWWLPSATGLEPQPAWNSAARLDAADASPARRTVLTWDGSKGAAFRWTALSSEQQQSLSSGEGEAAGQRRLDFIRGEHAAETAQGGPLRNRVRHSDGTLFRQGDIVHARPWFVPGRTAPASPRSAMVYVGGNDGMLHGFDALTGVERLGYVPQGVLPQLRELSEPGRPHRYLVDGHAFAGDTGAATLLVAAAGAGAKGYVVLDVSQPSGFSEAAAQQIVLLDTTGGRHADIGHMVSEPSVDAGGSVARQIVKLNNARWAAVLGNGVGSAAEMPVLLVQYLDRARELLTLRPACPTAPATCAHHGQGNGLATPLLIDTDGDTTADIAYAGDLLGHVWKFDLTSAEPAEWHVALGGQPLFTARGPDGAPQAITSAPIWLPHPQGGVMLGLGTGRALTPDDVADTRPQTLYGLHDTGARGPSLPINGPSDARRPANLVRQAILPQALERAGRQFFRSTAGDAAAQNVEHPRGWYLDLPARGERLLHAPQYFAGQKAMFTSSAPEGDFLTVLNLLTGAPSARPVFAALLDAGAQPTASASPNASRTALGRTGITAIHHHDELVLQPGAGQAAITLQKGKGLGLRAGWRQRP